MNTMILATLLTCIGPENLKLSMNLGTMTFSIFHEERLETGSLKQRGMNWAGPAYDLIFSDGEVLHYSPGHDGETALLTSHDERMQLVNCERNDE